MKFLALALALSAAPAALAQNFQTSCREIKGSDQYLSAICTASDGSEVCSEIDLTACLLNVNGGIVYANDVASGTGAAFVDARNGEFSRTGCQGCSVTDGTILTCEHCPDGRNLDAPSATFDLSRELSYCESGAGAA
ncbi:unnamed protein product [Parascedosporium putredinis]|uniref:Cyanovirin-N domain-containing protein n=1 Tax=Parascedosporium putredinis TaxID=1442378 RepID=A0A9P1GYY7_9PEZI|nr:unnamed protein product [Parascedosporium putredinis]CAI7991212.1 unnamed protein product [Parascedosporium putredinis]